MPASTKDGSTFREVRPWANVGNTWKKAVRGWIKKGGVWKRFFRSTPETWTQQQSLGTNDGVAVTFGNGVFVATTRLDAAIWRSTDNGQTWVDQQLPINWEDTNIPQLGYGNGVFVTCIEINDGSNDRYVWRSTDSGQTWTQQTLLSGEAIAFAYGNGVFVAATENDLWRSTDHGQSWQLQQTLSLPSFARPEEISYGNGVFVLCTHSGGYNSVWRSTDNGQSWSEQQVLDSPVFTVAYGDGIFIAGTDEYFWRSTDYGQTWTQQQALSQMKKSSVFVHGIFVVGTGFSASDIWVSEDGGQTWEQKQTLDDDIEGLAYGNDTYVALTSPGTIWRSI